MLRGPRRRTLLSGTSVSYFPQNCHLFFLFFVDFFGFFTRIHKKIRPDPFRAAYGTASMRDSISSAARSAAAKPVKGGEKRKIHAFGVALLPVDLSLPLAALPAGIGEDQIVHIVMAAYLPNHHGNSSFLYLDSTS